MANALITPDIIAKEALVHLDNNLVMAKLVHRDYEREFAKVGDTIRVRKPVRFTYRTGPTMALQDVEEGNTAVSLDNQGGVDFGFTSKDLTLTIEELSQRYIRPAMITIANEIDMGIFGLYKDVANWAGTPGQAVDGFPDFAQAPQRLDEGAVPDDSRSAVMSPADYYAMLGSISALYINDKAKTALERAKLGMIGNMDTYRAQNVPTHTVGAWGGTPVANTTAQASTWANVKSTNQQTLAVTGATASAAFAKAGDVFTIEDIYDVNPVSKTVLPRLKQFTVVSDATADGSGNVSLTITPAIIVSGAYQNCSATLGSGKDLTVLGTAATGYPVNLAFHKNAFALVMRPLEIPAGTVGGARESYKGLSVRVMPVYDGTNDVSKWRLDVLWGVKAIYPELATRLSGKA